MLKTSRKTETKLSKEQILFLEETSLQEIGAEVAEKRLKTSRAAITSVTNFLNMESLRNKMRSGVSVFVKM